MRAVAHAFVLAAATQQFCMQPGVAACKQRALIGGTPVELPFVAISDLELLVMHR